MAVWLVPTYTGFINPVPSVNSDGPLTNGALFLLWVGLLGSVALVAYGHERYQHDKDAIGLALATAPAITGGLMAAYLMRHYDSGWSSFWTFVLLVGSIAASALIQNVRFRGLGGISIGLATVVSGIGLVFDVANRVTAGVPISISGGIVVAFVVVIGVIAYGSSEN